MKRRAVFLDRDGVINEVILQDGVPNSPRRRDDFRILPGVKEAMAILRASGFCIIVVTNQPDVRRQLVSSDELERMHAVLKESVPVDDIFVCPHDDCDKCSCRKPKAGLFLQAAERWNIDLPRSYMLGDMSRDIEAGRNAGVTTVVISAPYNSRVQADMRASSLLEFARMLRQREERCGISPSG